MSAREHLSAAAVDALPAVRPRGSLHRILTMVAILALLTAIIAATAGGYWLKIFTASFAVALAAAGTGLLYGRLGLISLCQYALVGIGGWVTLRVFHAWHPPFESPCWPAGSRPASSACSGACRPFACAASIWRWRR